MADPKLVTVRSPFFVGNRLIGVGEVYAVDDPVVVGRPKAFGPVEVKSSVVAAPRRAARRPTTRKSPAKSTKAKKS